MADAFRSIPLYGDRVEMRPPGSTNPQSGIYYAGRADPAPSTSRGVRQWTVQWIALIVSPPDEMLDAQYAAQIAMIAALDAADDCGKWIVEPDAIDTPPLGANTGMASITVKFTVWSNA